MNVAEAAYVPDRSVLVHISWTLKLPDVPRPGMLEKVNCFVVAEDDVLIMNTWMPFIDAPE